MIPGVLESMVYCGWHAHLVSCRDGVISNLLHKQEKVKRYGFHRAAEMMTFQSEVYGAIEQGQNSYQNSSVHTWGVRAILIMVMMGGRSLRVSFRQRSSRFRSFSCTTSTTQQQLSIHIKHQPYTPASLMAPHPGHFLGLYVGSVTQVKKHSTFGFYILINCSINITKRFTKQQVMWHVEWIMLLWPHHSSVEVNPKPPS